MLYDFFSHVRTNTMIAVFFWCRQTGSDPLRKPSNCRHSQRGFLADAKFMSPLTCPPRGTRTLPHLDCFLECVTMTPQTLRFTVIRCPPCPVHGSRARPYPLPPAHASILGGAPTLCDETRHLPQSLPCISVHVFGCFFPLCVYACRSGKATS